MLEVFLLSVTFLITFYWMVKRKSKLSLPGPVGLPLLEYGPFLGEEPYKEYLRLAARYGPIFKVQLGMTEWIVLNSKELIRDALVKNSKVTAGRVHIAIIEAITQGRAAAFADGDLWQSLRGFEIKVLKSYGTARLEANVREEARYLCMKLAEKNGSPCDCENSLLAAVCNVTCHITMGHRYEYDDPLYQDILDAVKLLKIKSCL